MNLEWQDQGLCREVSPDLFFPEKGDNTRQAKSVCRACPVVNECLEYALKNGPMLGVWGGTSERERKHLNAVTRACRTCGGQRQPRRTYCDDCAEKARLARYNRYDASRRAS